MLFPSVDPNERFRSRRGNARRAKRRRRALVLGTLLLVVLGLAGGMTLAGKNRRETPAAATSVATSTPAVFPATIRPRPLPVEVRGVHVTGALASLPGKFQEYLSLIHI